MTETTSSPDTITFVDYYQTKLNAGTYEIKATLNAPEALKSADSLSQPIETKVKLHVAGPRFSLPPSEIHSVFPPENGEGDYNNVLPHVVINRRTLPWERLVDNKNSTKNRDEELEKIPFLALLVFSEDEEINGDVTPPTTISLADLLLDDNAKYTLEPGEKLTDKVNVIDVKPGLLEQVMPTGEELHLLAHGRERTLNENEIEHSRAVVIANRLPAKPTDSEPPKRNIAHLVMLENRYTHEHDGNEYTWTFSEMEDSSVPVRLVCLKSWQFTCSRDKPTLVSRLLGPDFTFEPLCIPKNADSFEQIRLMSYAALPYHLRWGDRAHTLYHGPLVALGADNGLQDEVPTSPEGLVRLLANYRIFDVSLAAAWQLGQMLMLRDQNVAMEYFSWRRRDAQLRAREANWATDGHLQMGDDSNTELTAMPDTVSKWFQERLKLRGIPFEYLVPDPRMLPENSLRIFKIHKGWMECLLSGALAVGRAGEADRLLEAKYRSAIYPLDAHYWSGFLLRSPAVEEHPDLEVLTEGTTSEVRLERIGPGLLLGLYAGTFSKLRFSLPPIGLHFGFKEEGDNFVKDIKNDADGQETTSGTKASVTKATATFRGERGERGERVVKIDELRDAMRSNLTPGSFAFQMCEGTEMVEFGVQQVKAERLRIS